jgi:serine protease Do
MTDENFLGESPEVPTHCENNFQVWIAFIFGLVCMVVAIGFFDLTMRQQRAATGGASSGGYGQVVSGKTDASLWIGIDAVDVDAATAAQLGLEQAQGVMITKVYTKSPAAEAGMQRGDVLVSFNRQKVKTLADLKEILKGVKPGEHVRACLMRGEARITVYVVPIERPVNATSLLAGEDASDIIWGMTISPLTPALKTRLSIPDKTLGVVVVDVSPGGLAEKGGVLPGDLIRSVNHRKTEDMESFFKVLSGADKGLLLDVYRAGEIIFVSVGTPKMPVPPIPANTGMRSVAGLSVAGQTVPALYVAGVTAAGVTAAASTAQVAVCICPVCKTTVTHPLSTPCSQLSCPVCGTRMVKAPS